MMCCLAKGLPFAKIERKDAYQFELVAELVTKEVIVPAGFVTDLASVPRVFWSVIPPYGRYMEAAIVHDYMYQRAYLTKAYADKIFRRNMKRYGVTKWRRVVMYWAVRLFGRGNY